MQGGGRSHADVVCCIQLTLEDNRLRMSSICGVRRRAGVSSDPTTSRCLANNDIQRRCPGWRAGWPAPAPAVRSLISACPSARPPTRPQLRDGPQLARAAAAADVDDSSWLENDAVPNSIPRWSRRNFANGRTNWNEWRWRWRPMLLMAGHAAVLYMHGQAVWT